MAIHPFTGSTWLALLPGRRIAGLLAILLAFASSSAAGEPPPLQVELAYPKTRGPATFTGRVFVIAARKNIGSGPFSQSWFSPDPFFAQEVVDWQPTRQLAFQPTVSFPESWAKLSPGVYWLQAIMDLDEGGQNALTSPGNLYSKPFKIEIKKDVPAKVSLLIDQVVPEKKFVEKPRVKLFEMESKLLTRFHGRPITLRAGVILPASYGDEPTRKYPVIYEIPGFSGTHHLVFRAEERNPTLVDGVDMLYVMLDPSCRLGHHVFADSANNGPVGQALIEEFIPALERQFRGLAKPNARFVTGHSSGGWSSLWLQISYPDFFGGVWSTAPDPVDFRDFQLVNIYQPRINLFTDEKGQLRPLARKDGKVAFTYKRFSDMEVVLGRGGQLFSFEAVFSPKGPDGKPLALWDRSSGAVHSSVARAWTHYDIRQILERRWPVLGPKLAGKLHVYMGAEDTYYLEGATRLLQGALKSLKSDAKVELFPGRNHGNLLDAPLRQRIAREMAELYRKRGEP